MKIDEVSSMVTAFISLLDLTQGGLRDRQRASK
jgi:hypothetical protein